MDIEKTDRENDYRREGGSCVGHGFYVHESHPAPRDPFSVYGGRASRSCGNRQESRTTASPQSEPATAFPTAVTAASSWNPETARAGSGRAIGEECRYYGVHVLLGPGK